MAETKQTQTPPDPAAAPPAAAITDEMRTAIKDAVSEAFVEWLDSARTEVEGEIDQPTEARTIQHALFSYALPGGGHAVAMRGATVDLLPHDIERGERFDAFTEVPGKLPEPAGSALMAFPVGGSQAEQDNWIGSGSVQEIVDAVNAHPEIVGAVIEAENRRKADARPSLLEALAKINAS